MNTAVNPTKNAHMQLMIPASTIPITLSIRRSLVSVCIYYTVKPQVRQDIDNQSTSSRSTAQALDPSYYVE